MVDKEIDINKLVNFFKINLKGVIHVGANKCEE